MPAENYITIQKIKYAGSEIIGANSGYVLEIDENNPFVTDDIAQNILLKMQGFTFIPYTYQATISDFATDVGDKFDITNTNNTKYLTYVMGNSWEFNGAVSQTWTAKGENELNNTYSSKGPITQQIENIVKEQIPSVYDKAVEKATELITKFNGGCVIKKAGELFIADNEDLDQAQHIWRWNMNGLGYSSTGINGPYGLAMTMDGKIVADFIASGTMSAERINGGTLKLGGNNNTNGAIQVVDANGDELVTISKDGVVLSNGTKLIGNGGVLSNLQFNSFGVSEEWGDTKKAGEYNMLGFMSSELTGTDKYNIYIDVVIPDNFTVISAYITLRHIPYFVSMEDNSVAYGYARNVKCYVSEIDGSISVSGYEGSEYYPELSGINFSEITACFNTTNNTFTPVKPTSSNYNVEEIKTNNIASQIANNSRIKIATTNSNPSTAKACFEQTGFVFAQLNVYGYLN